MKKSLLFLIILLLSSFTVYGRSSWTQEALNLFDENQQVSAGSSRKLQADKNLLKDLKSAFLSGTHRDLAAEVTGKLKLATLVDELIQCAQNDDSLGACHRAMLNFDDKRSADKIRGYAESISADSSKKSDIAKGFLLILSKRENIVIKTEFLTHVMTQENSALKEMAMDYLENKTVPVEDLKTLSEAVYASRPYQNRLRFTHYLARRGELKHFFHLCREDKNAEVAQACKESKESL